MSLNKKIVPPGRKERTLLKGWFKKAHRMNGDEIYETFKWLVIEWLYLKKRKYIHCIFTIGS